MSLQVPSYANPYASTPLANAYAWISSIHLDFATGSGLVVVNVNTDAASADAGLPPIKQEQFILGMGSMPGLSALLTESAQAFGTFRQSVYNHLASQPQFAGSTQVA